MSTQGGVGAVLDKKVRARYKVTRASLVWFAAALLLLPYEILCVARGVEGGPLTHVVKFCYGQPRSIRWWLVGWPVSGFLLWLVPHFLFEGWGFRALIAFVLAGLIAGVIGIVVGGI